MKKLFSCLVILLIGIMMLSSAMAAPKSENKCLKNFDLVWKLAKENFPKDIELKPAAEKRVKNNLKKELEKKCSLDKNRLKKTLAVLVAKEVRAREIKLQEIKLPLPTAPASIPKPEPQIPVINSPAINPPDSNLPVSGPSNPVPEQQPEQNNNYPLHQNIWTTYFWVGEPAGPENGYISNEASAWDEKWVGHYGGIDNPKQRNGYYPAGFIPKENPFYCALPHGDFNDAGKKSNLNKVYWYQPGDENQGSNSILKNRWIKVSFNGKSCYCQWEDVGPAYSDDWPYVFGEKRPLAETKNPAGYQSGLDVSPAMRDCLGLTGYDQTNWQFVDAENVPGGPWKEIVTTSGTCWLYPGSSCE